MLSLHALGNHEHSVCTSKVESHIHEKDLDCELHLLKQNDTFLASQDFQIRIDNTINENIVSKYNFLKNHSQLSFSLRGPPSFI